MPSFAVGALLLDDGADLDEGRRRLRVRIAAQHGITPRGVDGAPSFWLRYETSKRVFGRATSLRCPFYDDGRCTVWKQREAMCATYFCKHEAGADGHTFWTAARTYLDMLADALVTHAMLELGFTPARALAAPPADVIPEDLDGRPLPRATYAERWGRYAVLDVINAFDGRPHDEVLASLRAHQKPIPSQRLLAKLYHHRVLVDARSCPLAASAASAGDVAARRLPGSERHTVVEQTAHGGEQLFPAKQPGPRAVR